MRSRYTAFALSDIDYLVKTSSEHQAQISTPSQLQDTADSLTFVKLEVIYADKCQVEFKASYLIGDKLEQIHERSDFVLENDEWKYDSGTHFDTPTIRIKRNDPCPCGSGKKFKKCHQ
jgi:SEC-C motif-containing protein